MSDEEQAEASEQEADSAPQAAAIARAAYDAIDALNWSRLKLLEKSPTHYRTGFGDETATFRLGTAAHMALLEPERFATEYVVYPGKVRRGKEWEKFETEALRSGKAVLSRKEHATAVATRDAVRGHERAVSYLRDGEPERTLVWDVVAGELRFKCKGRADYIGPRAIVDFKSTNDASPEGFGWSVRDYGYLGQAAWYSDGLWLATGARLPFVFIAVEKKPPFMVGVYRVTDEQLEEGRELYLSLLGKLDYCTKNNWWSGYTESAESDLVIPRRRAA